MLDLQFLSPKLKVILTIVPRSGLRSPNTSTSVLKHRERKRDGVGKAKLFLKLKSRKLLVLDFTVWSDADVAQGNPNQHSFFLDGFKATITQLVFLFKRHT